MKPIHLFTVCVSLILGFGAGAADPDPKPDAEEALPDNAASEQAKPGEKPLPATNSVQEEKSPEILPMRGDKGIRLNFRGAPLEQVLNYLSEAAGFIIILETELKGKVDVWSNQPVTKEEAVDLLNTVLNKNGYAAIRNGRSLTIVKREDAKKRDLPVKSGNDPAGIPKNEQMVTQIIPVRHANATQLSRELQPLLATSAEMTPDESANALVLTDTQSNIRRMAEIIKALDDSISSTSTVHVFPLRYADAKELATVVKELFQPTQQQGNNNNNRGGNQFAGGRFGGFGGAGGGGGGRGGGGGGSTAGAANTRVTAVAHEWSNSLVVAAPEDLLSLITDMVEQVDQPIADITRIEVFHLVNADPNEMADMFSQLFPDESKTSNGNNQQGFRFGPFGPAGQRGAASQANPSDRMKKKGQVVVVPDARTSSIIVSAANDLMPQIQAMVAQLDSSPAKKQKVFVYSLQNADPQEVLPILQDMFQRSTTSLNRNTANQNSALTSRIQANNQNISSGINNGNSGLGNMGLGNNSSFGGGSQTLR